MTLKIHDTRNRLYELTPAAMIERGRGSWYAITKRAFFDALDKGLAKVETETASKRVEQFNLGVHTYAKGRGVYRIGCRRFNVADAVAIYKWAGQ